MPAYKPFTLCAFLLLFLGCAAQAQPSSCREPRELNIPELQKLWQDFTILSSDELQGRKSGTRGIKLARDYIIQEYQKIGLTQLNHKHDKNFDSTGWLHLFGLRGKAGDLRGANVIGEIIGSEFPQQYLVLTAHYDHLGTKGRQVFNGANDNASGVAAMLYIARMLRLRKPANSVLFVATDNEEDGLYGAKAFVKDKLLSKSQMMLNVNLDMIAQPGKTWRLYVSGTRSHPWLVQPVEQMISSAPVCVKKGNDGSGWNYNRQFRINWRKASDHWAFAKQDIPWLYLGVKDYRYYHTPRDTADKIPQSFYFGVAHSSFMLVNALDSYFLSRN